MANSDLVSVFYGVNDAARADQYTREKCHSLRDEGKGFFCHHGKDFCLYESYVHELTGPPQESETPLTGTCVTHITSCEMEMNGLFKQSADGHGFRAEKEELGKAIQAREKIKAWPFIGDNLAVRVGIRA